MIFCFSLWSSELFFFPLCSAAVSFYLCPGVTVFVFLSVASYLCFLQKYGKRKVCAFPTKAAAPFVRLVQPRDTSSNHECSVEVCGERACKWVSLLLCLWLLGIIYFHAIPRSAINKLNIVELLTHLYHIFIFLLSSATCVLLLMSHLSLGASVFP